MFRDIARIKKSAQLFKLLGNPYRLQIIMLLLQGEKNVTEINKEVQISQPALSQHLSKLREGGVLLTRRNRREIYYSINNPQTVRMLTIAGEVGHSGTAEPMTQAV